MEKDIANRLLPRPRRIEPREGRLVLGDKVRLVVTGPEPASFAGERLAELLREEFDVSLPVTAEEGQAFQILLLPDGRAPVFPPLAEAAKTLDKEGYTLEIGAAGARVQSPTAQGLFWGAMTLRQCLAASEGHLSAPGVRITDWPRYPWRGFMIDSGRSPNSLAQIKRIIRICSAFKLNFVVFREGDDEMAAVRYRTNKLGSADAHALSMNQVRELIEYAYQHGIVVVPEIESLGHSTAKGFYYPGLTSGGFEQPYEGIGVHIRKSHLHVGDPRSYELLASIYDEWFPLLKSPLVHLGLDEVRLPQEEQARHLQLLLQRVNQVAAKHNRKIAPVVWADAPATPEEFRQQVIRCLWGYAEDAVSLENEHLVGQGMADLSMAGCQENVFMAGGSGALHQPYTKSDYAGAFKNLADWAILGKERLNFVGLFAVQWSGNMLDDWLPDFLAAADYAWNPPDEAPAFDGEMARIKTHLARLGDAARPNPAEVDRPAWDGIWLNGQDWGEDIRTGKKKPQNA